MFVFYFVFWFHFQYQWKIASTCSNRASIFLLFTTLQFWIVWCSITGVSTLNTGYLNSFEVCCHGRTSWNQFRLFTGSPTTCLDIGLLASSFYLFIFPSSKRFYYTSSKILTLSSILALHKKDEKYFCFIMEPVS